MRREALSWFTKVKLEAGYVVVLETAGRSGHWNPPLPILLSSGGMTPQKRWRGGDDFPCKGLHKKWPYHLCTMVQHRVGTRVIRDKIAGLWHKYPRGLVAYLEEGKVPAGGEGLAYYLAKYVVSPPISLRRILSYDGQRVRYGYNDHKTKQRQEEEVSALTCIGRMGQHMLPKGFHRIRYYGLHATCKAKKVKGGLTALMVALGRLSKGTDRITARQTYRERVLASTGRDPLRCACCGGEMLLWQVWHPRYGVVYDEVQAIKRGRYSPCRGSPPGTGVDGDGEKAMTQLALAELLV
jgi:Putative transposase